MDINQLIADLQEISRKNSISHYKRDRCAAAARSTLQAENEKLRAEVKQAKAERDAAMEHLHGIITTTRLLGTLQTRRQKKHTREAAESALKGEQDERI